MLWIPGVIFLLILAWIAYKIRKVNRILQGLEDDRIVAQTNGHQADIYHFPVKIPAEDRGDGNTIA